MKGLFVAASSRLDRLPPIPLPDCPASAWGDACERTTRSEAGGPFSGRCARPTAPSRAAPTAADPAATATATCAKPKGRLTMINTPDSMTMNDVRDAIALTRAHLTHDLEARRTIAANARPEPTLRAVVALYAALLVQACGDGAMAYLDELGLRILLRGDALLSNEADE